MCYRRSSTFHCFLALCCHSLFIDYGKLKVSGRKKKKKYTPKNGRIKTYQRLLQQISGGSAGLAALKQLSNLNKQAILIEAGRKAGSKNLSGGYQQRIIGKSLLLLTLSFP